MYSIYVLCSFAYLSAYLSPILALHPALRQPSNISLSAIGLSNYTLDAWPTQLPWTLYINNELTMDFVDYGEYANPAMWNDIRNGLDDIAHSIQHEGDWVIKPWSDRNIYTRQAVAVEFSADFRPGSLEISPTDIAKVLRAVNGLFFIYKDKPREFDAEIKTRRQSGWYMTLNWESFIVAWPRRLPWTMTHGGSSTFALEIYLYGRDADPAWEDEVDDDIDQLISIIENEGPATSLLTKHSYQYRHIRLDIEGPAPGDVKELMTRYDTLDALDTMQSMYDRYGLREFGAYVTEQRRSKARIFLTFTD